MNGKGHVINEAAGGGRVCASVVVVGVGVPVAARWPHFVSRLKMRGSEMQLAGSFGSDLVNLLNKCLVTHP